MTDGGDVVRTRPASNEVVATHLDGRERRVSASFATTGRRSSPDATGTFASVDGGGRRRRDRRRERRLTVRRSLRMRHARGRDRARAASPRRTVERSNAAACYPTPGRTLCGDLAGQSPRRDGRRGRQRPRVVGAERTAHPHARPSTPATRSLSPSARTETFVASASADGTGRVWRTRDWGLNSVLTGHTNALTNVSFSADSEQVVTTGRDGTARVSDMQEQRRALRPGRTPQLGRVGRVHRDRRKRNRDLEPRRHHQGLGRGLPARASRARPPLGSRRDARCRRPRDRDRRATGRGTRSISRRATSWRPSRRPGASRAVSSAPTVEARRCAGAS